MHNAGGEVAPLPVGYRLPAGGLPSAAKALLVPENIRSGVHIKGGGVDVTGGIYPSNMAFYWIACWCDPKPYTWIIPSNTDLVDVHFSLGKGATITFKTAAALQCRDVPQIYGGYCRIDGKNVVKDAIYHVTQGSVMQWSSTAGGPYYGAFDYA